MSLSTSRVRTWPPTSSGAVFNPSGLARPPDLAGTTQATQRHGDTATVRDAEAQHETDPQRRERLEREAEASAPADLLDRQSAQLEKADEIRALWYAHIAGTRAAADRVHRLVCHGR